MTVQEAIARLRKSERGERALSDLRQMMKNGDDVLDGQNRAALMALMECYWDDTMAVDDQIVSALGYEP